MEVAAAAVVAAEVVRAVGSLKSISPPTEDIAFPHFFHDIGSRGSSSDGSCSGDDCNRAGIIAGSVIGGICGLAALIFGSIFCYRRYKRKSRLSNSAFVNQPVPKTELCEKDHFDNGVWSSEYHQYGTWHGHHQCTLRFDRQTNQITGEGNDDVGRFAVDGTFSTEGHRMGFTKSYQLGTGNPAENSGHTVTVQLTWNPSTLQFEGKWYVQTAKYRGEDDFRLKFKDYEQISNWFRNSLHSIKYASVAFIQARIVLVRNEWMNLGSFHCWRSLVWRFDRTLNIERSYLARQSPYRVILSARFLSESDLLTHDKTKH